MKIVLDRKMAEQIAEEASQLRSEVIKAGELFEQKLDRESGHLFNKARVKEEEFLRALYVIGVVGVNWIDTNDQRYAFDLGEALAAIEEEGGAK